MLTKFKFFVKGIHFSADLFMIFLICAFVNDAVKRRNEINEIKYPAYSFKNYRKDFDDRCK